MNRNLKVLLVLMAVGGLSMMCLIAGSVTYFVTLLARPPKTPTVAVVPAKSPVTNEAPPGPPIVPSDPAAKPTTAKPGWTKYLAERERLRDEIVTEIGALQGDNKGRVPSKARTELMKRAREMDKTLQALAAEVTSKDGPPPNELMSTVFTPLAMEASREMARRPGANMMAQGSGMPPGTMPPGAMPPGMLPPGAMPPGMMPPGAMPPGMAPPSGFPQGGFPQGGFPQGPGGVPPSGLSPDLPPAFDAEGFQAEQKRQRDAMISRDMLERQAKEADRIRDEVADLSKLPEVGIAGVRQTLTREQRTILRELEEAERTLRREEMGSEAKLELLHRYDEQVLKFKSLGRDETERLRELAMSEQAQKDKQRQRLEDELRTKNNEVAAKAFAAAAVEAARLEEEGRLARAQIMADFNKREAERLRKQTAAEGEFERVKQLSLVNALRKRQGLAPLSDLLVPISAALSDKESAPGFEVQQIGQLKPKDRVFVHAEGKWQDATVQTKRGIYVQVVFVALENSEVVTLDRIRLHKDPAPKDDDAPPTTTVAATPRANAATAVEPPADSTASGLRTWTSRNGEFKIEAELVGSENGAARLRRADGKILNVPLEKLSADDEQLVRQKFP